MEIHNRCTKASWDEYITDPQLQILNLLNCAKEKHTKELLINKIQTEFQKKKKFVRSWAKDYSSVGYFSLWLDHQNRLCCHSGHLWEQGHSPSLGSRWWERVIINEFYKKIPLGAFNLRPNIELFSWGREWKSPVLFFPLKNNFS